MAYVLRDRMTPGRLARLRQLEQGPAKRGRGPAGFQCWKLGWAEWVREADGLISDDALEQLTDLGRQRLYEAIGGAAAQAGKEI